MNHLNKPQVFIFFTNPLLYIQLGITCCFYKVGSPDSPCIKTMIFLSLGKATQVVIFCQVICIFILYFLLINKTIH